MEILIAEDDKILAQSLEKGLAEEGFSVVLVSDGFEARDKILSKKWDVFIFDLMLPRFSGLQLCELTRFKKINTPVLVLSALSEAEDRIKALDIGADDYLTKPFNFKELVSRINALNRRNTDYSTHGKTTIEYNNLSLDYTTFSVEREGKPINLSTKEFNLLKLLLENQERVVSRAEILRKVWQTPHDTFTNVIDVYISYLRSKIDSSFTPKLIQTVKGRGYMITDKNEN